MLILRSLSSQTLNLRTPLLLTWRSSSAETEVMSMPARLVCASTYFGTKVSINPKGKGGTIEISYFSDDDLERILELLSEFEG